MERAKLPQACKKALIPLVSLLVQQTAYRLIKATILIWQVVEAGRYECGELSYVLLVVHEAPVLTVCELENHYLRCHSADYGQEAGACRLRWYSNRIPYARHMLTEAMLGQWTSMLSQDG
jgi:hypothetical protein